MEETDIPIELFRTSPDDQPHLLANRRAYALQPYRTVRFVIEADVEWRETDPDYAQSVAALADIDDDRIKGTHVISTEFISEPHSRPNPWWDAIISKWRKTV